MEPASRSRRAGRPSTAGAAAGGVDEPLLRQVLRGIRAELAEAANRGAGRGGTEAGQRSEPVAVLHRANRPHPQGGGRRGRGDYLLARGCPWTQETSRSLLSPP